MSKEPKYPEWFLRLESSPGVYSRALQRTTDAVSLSAIPTILFVALYLALVRTSPDAEIRALANEPSTLSSMLTRACYYSYFSVASILLFSMKDFLRRGAGSHLAMIAYLVVFTTFANEVIAFLLDELAFMRAHEFKSDRLYTAAFFYALTVWILFVQFIAKEVLSPPSGARLQEQSAAQTSRPGRTQQRTGKADNRQKVKPAALEPQAAPWRLAQQLQRHWILVVAFVCATASVVLMNYVPSNILAVVGAFVAVFGTVFSGLSHVKANLLSGPGQR